LDDNLKTEQIKPPVECILADGTSLLAKEKVDLKMEIQTMAGPVKPMGKIKFLVIPSLEDEILIGHPFLKSIGIDIDAQLESLARSDPTDTNVTSGNGKNDKNPQLTENDLPKAIGEMIDKAIANGFPEEYRDKLSVIVRRYDIWRIELGNDPPARVPPMEIRLKQGVDPFKCRPRKYPPEQELFMKTFNAKLEELGWVRRNPTSRWACPAMAIKKPKSNEYRQANDYRPVNAKTVPIAGTMPHLPTIVEHAKGNNHFGLFDFIKGFWQLPLAESSQEILSYMTHDTIYTPHRVPQGCTDAALHFQAIMMECFRLLLYDHLLVWIDDLLLYAKTIDEYLESMEKLFELMDHYGLKLSVLKSDLYKQQVKWCGKIIDKNGIRHDPERIQALMDMPYPVTAGQLQQFICASNWMRDSIIDFSRVIQPLQKRLDHSLQGTKRSKRIASGIQITLTKEEKECFDHVKATLHNSATLSYPTDEATLCLFTDASDNGWAIIITQVQEWDDSKTPTNQAHELLVCMSGTFHGAELNWSVIEKEAYPIVQACTHLDYLLLRPGGFRMFCDHRNLIHIFAPGKEIKKHVRGKLLRWANRLMEYNYVIEHIEGPNNVWADMVSRWANRPKAKLNKFTYRKHAHKKRKSQARSTINVALLRPLDSESFIWPTLEEIKQAQESKVNLRPTTAECTDDIWYIDGRIWIPPDLHDLIQRLLIISHCGAQGHRGIQVMKTQLSKMFYIQDQTRRVSDFVRSCLVCQRIKGPKIVKRPWSEAFNTDERNGALHWDFLYLGESFGTSKYILVMKDEATHFCQLVVCDTPNSAVAVDALLQWHSGAGLPPLWISDSATHFKNEVIAELARRLKCQQDFITAYSPWINGTVERVNRDILQVLRAMLAEYRLSELDWPYFIPIIQHNLNHTPVTSLQHHAPVELYMGLPRQSALDTVHLPNSKRSLLEIHITEPIETQLAALRTSLHNIHKKVLDAREIRARFNQENVRRGEAMNFHEGDYVLRSRVDQKSGNKLLATWIGPYKILTVASRYCRVQHLVTSEEVEVHPSRLKFYADKYFNVTNELLEDITSQGTIFDVEKLQEHRWHKEMQDYEVKIKWKGLDSIEDSWEPLQKLFKEIPTLLSQYIEETKDKQLIKYWNEKVKVAEKKTNKKITQKGKVSLLDI
jgi:hypothetical protein